MLWGKQLQKLNGSQGHGHIPDAERRSGLGKRGRQSLVDRFPAKLFQKVLFPASHTSSTGCVPSIGSKAWRDKPSSMGAAQVRVGA